MSMFRNGRISSSDRILSVWFFSAVSIVWAILGKLISVFIAAERTEKYMPDVYWAMTHPIVGLDVPASDIRHSVMESAVVREAIAYNMVKEQQENNISVIEEYDPLLSPTVVSKSVNSPSMSKSSVSKKVDKSRKRKAMSMLNEMVIDRNTCTIRVIAYVLCKIWRVLYIFGIHVDLAEIERVRHSMRTSPHPLLYLPTHKSHVDYFLMIYVCFKYELALPCIAVSDDLNFPIFGRILRSSGAFFIRRGFFTDSDPLYGVVFREYIKTLMRTCQAMSAFIEEDRSRTGKVLPPKFGLLQSVISSLDDGSVVDVSVVPISISYDRIVETSSHIKDIVGEKSNLFNAKRTISLIYSVLASFFTEVLRNGRVDIRMAEPISLQLFTGTLSLASLTECARTKMIAYKLGYRVLYDTNRVCSVPPASLVATILLSHYQRGISRDELYYRVQWLHGEITARGGEVPPIDQGIIDHVVFRVFSGIVGSNMLVKHFKNRLMVSLYSPNERVELSLYRNQLIHHFVDEALVTCAFYAFEKMERGNSCHEHITDAPVMVPRSKVMNACDFLSELLTLEFIYKPAPSAKMNFKDTLKQLLDRGVFVSTEDENAVFVAQSEESTFNYLFLCSLLWQSIDSYWLVSLCLLAMLPARFVHEDFLVAKMQSIGEELYFYGGSIDLIESVCSVTLQNALSLFESWGVVEFVKIEGLSSSPESSGKRIIKLSEKYQDENTLLALITRIGTFRKRSQAYRSRRYKLRGNTVDKDAILLVKELIRKEKEDASISAIERVWRRSLSSARISTAEESRSDTQSPLPSPLKYQRIVDVGSTVIR